MKKKTYNSVLAFILVFVMALSLSACTGSKDTNETTAPSAATETYETTAEPTEIATETTAPTIAESEISDNEDFVGEEAEIEEMIPEVTEEKEATGKSDPKEEAEEDVKAVATYKEVCEIVYAYADVNIREEPDVSSKKLGYLTFRESIIRTGIGDNGWSRVIYKDMEAYIGTNYLGVKEPAPDPVPTDDDGRAFPTTPEATDPEHTHVYVGTIVPPTCTEGGFTKHSCTCGMFEKDSETAALGHDFGDWTIVREPTVNTMGERHRVCKVCEYVEVDFTDKIPENFAS